MATHDERLLLPSTARDGLTKVRIFGFLALILLVLAAAGSSLAPHDPFLQDLDHSLLPPGGAYPLGTDRFGRCVFSRVLAGSTVSLYASLAVVGMTMAVGTITGLVAGFFGGRTDQLLMRCTDVFLAFPIPVFAMVAAALLGRFGSASQSEYGGLAGAMAALTLISWPKYARLVRSCVLDIRHRPFIAAARFSGCSRAEILFRQILPLVLGPTLIMMTSDMGTVLLEMAGLSFLGLGVQPPAAEWGLMIGSARSLLQTAPWVLFAPGAALLVTVTVFNLLGDSLQDVLTRRSERGMQG
ncbi:MAG: ABC transporter permease [Succiniclasticum sp.]|jgi:peptide/nickel transport system permease protein